VEITDFNEAFTSLDKAGVDEVWNSEKAYTFNEELTIPMTLFSSRQLQFERKKAELSVRRSVTDENGKVKHKWIGTLAFDASDYANASKLKAPIVRLDMTSNGAPSAALLFSIWSTSAEELMVREMLSSSAASPKKSRRTTVISSVTSPKRARRGTAPPSLSPQKGASPPSPLLLSRPISEGSDLSKGGPSALGHFKNFHKATRVEEVLVHFYRLQEALGIFSNERSENRYSKLRNAVMPLCKDYFVGKRVFTTLDDKIATMSPGTTGLSITVVGAGPVGLRTAIELVLLGQKVTVVEQYTPDKVDRRPNVLKLWKWTFDDLHALGVPTSEMNGKGNKHIRTDILQLEFTRIALLLGVDFLFGTSFVSLRPLPVAERGTLGGGKWGMELDFSNAAQGASACSSASASSQEGVNYCLATFGMHLEPAQKPDDVVNKTTLRDLRQVRCHAVIGAGGVRDPVRAAYKFNIVTTKIADAVGLVTFFSNKQTKQERNINEVLWARQFNVPPIKRAMEKHGAEMENLVYFQTPNLHYLVMTPTRNSLQRLGIIGDDSVKVRDQARLETFAKKVGQVVGLPKNVQVHSAENPTRLFDFSERSQAAESCKVRRAMFVGGRAGWRSFFSAVDLCVRQRNKHTTFRTVFCARPQTPVFCPFFFD
jgi:2-polyprenyl-6-methoxyphenol hydroxylase-like FAD-dependent oxidoreductase